MEKTSVASPLKIRAKRLRAGLKDLCDVHLTASQALELVAKEEGYPNWDAASACYTPPHPAPRQRQYIDLSKLDIQSRHIIVRGVTNSGKTTLATELARLYKRRQTTQCDILIIAPTRESDFEHLSPYDEQFEEKIAAVDMSRTILVIDDVRVGRVTQWLDLVKNAMFAVVTMHSGESIEIPDSFLHIDCNKA